MNSSNPLIFDGHNDVLSKIFSEGGVIRATSFYNGRKGALDLQKAQVGGFEMPKWEHYLVVKLEQRRAGRLPRNGG